MIAEKDYEFEFSFILPEIIRSKRRSVFRKGYLRVFKFSLPTKFYLTNDDYTGSMGFSILGFGFKVDIRVVLPEGGKRE